MFRTLKVLNLGRGWRAGCGLQLCGDVVRQLYPPLLRCSQKNVDDRRAAASTRPREGDVCENVFVPQRLAPAFLGHRARGGSEQPKWWAALLQAAVGRASIISAVGCRYCWVWTARLDAAPSAPTPSACGLAALRSSYGAATVTTQSKATPTTGTASTTRRRGWRTTATTCTTAPYISPRP